MAEPMVQEVETKSAFINKKYKNEDRLKKEEEELEQLLAEQKGETQEVEAEPAGAEEKSFKKRYGDLRRHMQQKEKEWDEKFNNLKSRMERESIVPPKSDDDIEEWAKQYPDVAGIVETIAAKKAQEMFKKAEDRLAQLDELQYETERKSAEAKIREAHSDFDTLRNSDGFHDWAEKQPKWVRDALYENMDDPASVIRVIDLYKVDNGQTPQAKKAKSKDAAKSVGKGTRTQVDATEAGSMIKESDVAKMSAKEFEAREEEITKAMRTGKFVYDLSAGAR